MSKADPEKALKEIEIEKEKDELLYLAKAWFEPLKQKFCTLIEVAIGFFKTGHYHYPRPLEIVYKIEYDSFGHLHCFLINVRIIKRIHVDLSESEFSTFLTKEDLKNYSKMKEIFILAGLDDSKIS